MDRRSFLERTSAMGLGALFLPTMLGGCSDEIDPTRGFTVNFSGNVLIIGAGAAGLTAGHLLNQYGIDFRILEASSVYGGRVRAMENFADFPIDLGAEWIHTDPSILATLLNDPDAQANIDIIRYKPETFRLWKNGKLRQRNYFSNFYGEYKFKNTTWFSYFDNYFVPGIRDRIQLNTPVTRIDYSGNRIVVTTSTNEVLEADRLILTVPLTVLQDGDIEFVPALPSAKTTAISGADMPDGIKVFMEFSEQFYPDIMFDGGLFDALDDSNGEKIYYNAAFRKDSNRNICALFSVGDPATEYTSIGSDPDLIRHILNELDERFDGKPSETYLQHVTQNWSNEPFIRGSYSHSGDADLIQTLAESINNKIFFAGEAYHTEETATVHGAALTAYDAVEELLKNEGG